MDIASAELTAKIDALTAQVEYLSAQARLAERQRQERAELVRDVTPIANQAFHIAIEQLEEVQEYVDLADLLRLLKRLLRNARNLERMLDQLEAVSDLADTLGPLTDQAFEKSVDALAEMERKGYFAFARGGAHILDTLVTSFSEEDVRRLGDNIVLIANTVKDMTQPEILSFVRNTLVLAEQELEQPLDTSTLGLLRQMGDPRVRRGLALTLRVLQAIGAQAGAPSR
jgi:uncharacterized protein YjgD (DUF1641 family)